MSDPLAEYDVARVRADNPSPLTLTGTNTYVVGRNPCWVVDPGPADLDAHVAAVLAEGAARGGIGGVALTHRHADHAGAVDALVAGAGGAVPVAVGVEDGALVGPLEAIALPGHAVDHVCFALGSGGLCFTGDAVLGSGSVFISPDPGALASYLAGLERLRARRFALLAPGHGPLVEDPDAKLEAYVAHRLDRERRLLAALDGGARTIDALLDAAWDDVPDTLRLPATVTLFAHLDKLAEEGRVPAGVEARPEWFAQLGRHAR